jgi:hypothetical protein
MTTVSTHHDPPPVSAGFRPEETVQVEILKPIIVGGEDCEPGDVVNAYENEARIIIGEGSAKSPGPTAPPVCSTTPYVSGTGTVGQTLQCTMGNWTGEPTSYSYLWKRDGVTDVGTGNAYTVADIDVGHSLTCIVTATNAKGSTAAPPSNAVAVA